MKEQFQNWLGRQLVHSAVVSVPVSHQLHSSCEPQPLTWQAAEDSGRHIMMNWLLRMIRLRTFRFLSTETPEGNKFVTGLPPTRFADG